MPGLPATPTTLARYYTPAEPGSRRSARHAVRLPKEFQFNTDEVFIRKEGEDVILSPRPTDWGPYLDGGPIASDAFMENVEDLPVQEREG